MNVIRFSDRIRRPSRRDFLKLATSALLTTSGLIGAATLLRFLDFPSEPAPRTDFDLGPASAFPQDSRTVISDIPAIIIRTQDNFTALSLICTHLGCTVEGDGNGFICPCHGSRYDDKGQVTRGPASRALRSLRVEVTDEGHLAVHTA